MKEFNIEIGENLILKSLIYRVKARNKKEAVEKVKTLGFNCGLRLSSSFAGDFKASIIEEIKPNEYIKSYDELEALKWYKIN